MQASIRYRVLRWGMEKELRFGEIGLPRAIKFTFIRVGTNRNCLVGKSQALTIEYLSHLAELTVPLHICSQ